MFADPARVPLGTRVLSFYVPTALSRAEARALADQSRDRRVVEAGSLLGGSTLVLASAAREVVSIDRHNGYVGRPNDTYRALRRNLEVAGVGNAHCLVGDFMNARVAPESLPPSRRAAIR